MISSMVRFANFLNRKLFVEFITKFGKEIDSKFEFRLEIFTANTISTINIFDILITNSNAIIKQFICIYHHGSNIERKARSFQAQIYFNAKIIFVLFPSIDNFAIDRV